MNSPRLSFLISSIFFAAACGEKGVDTEGTPTTTDATTETATDGTTAPTTGEPACVDPSLTEFGPSVEVTLRNDGDARLFVNLQENCTTVLPFSLRDASDAEVVINKDACDSACEAVLSGGCGCPAGCPIGDVIQLEPGGTFVASWTGRVWAEVTLPAECPKDGCAPQCFAAGQASEGTYTVVARAHDAVGECLACTCEPGPEGSCVVSGAIAMGAEVVAEAELAYPMQTALAVTFE
ncbi:hypothetical protein SAMN02745121_01158 [Nannocystis exedens]|uniref:Thaumatin family protein n=1 Tax=Nannocystis exedens TaxID=54 RepID=A0A1I1UGI8_9BACT|nr:hypothetical protein [Nannocystis exedens]PCC71614.1 hypothetical protein NAEX_04691 [Nannocystis exedens]SFD68728.1 hypothetical protein SAMN02745121_01158 [Nannocystis exedens]